VIASVRDELRDHEECDHRDRASDQPRSHGSRIALEVVRAIGGFDHPTVANYGRLRPPVTHSFGPEAAAAYARHVEIRFCDDRGAHGFSWIVDEPATRTSHVLASDGRVWLVDPVRYEPALERARALGEPVAVLQLLDRHNRDCAGVASTLGVPHLVVPDALPDSPFAVIRVRQTTRWREVALWWQAERTLVVAEAIGTNGFYAPPGHDAGVHLLLRLSPPRDALGAFPPEHLLVGHGDGLHGSAAASGLRDALGHARKGLPRIALRVPALALDAARRRHRSADG